jgi:hypothetical protein
MRADAKPTPVTPDELLATAMYNRRTNINKMFTDIKEDNIVDGEIIDRGIENMKYGTFYQKIKPRSGKDMQLPLLLYLMDYLGYTVLVQDLQNPEKIYSLYSENDPL